MLINAVYQELEVMKRLRNLQPLKSFAKMIGQMSEWQPLLGLWKVCNIFSDTTKLIFKNSDGSKYLIKKKKNSKNP